MSVQPTISTAVPALRGERIAYGAVHLDVVDLDRSLSFWRERVGLTELDRDDARAVLGAGERPLVVLHAGASAPAGGRHSGLYHLAIHLPDATEFARVLVRLARARVPQAPTDHIFSKATYLHDPDGIMLELTLETPERYGRMEISPGSVRIHDSTGARRGPTEPLDVADAIAPLGGGDPELPLPAGAYVGHVHLHVPDLRAAHDFYRDVVGFEEHAYMDSIGMADLGAGGAFPHRLAINTWNGVGARPAPAGTAGLRRFELLVPDTDALEALAARAGVGVAGDGAVTLGDPAGNRVEVRA